MNMELGISEISVQATTKDRAWVPFLNRGDKYPTDIDEATRLAARTTDRVSRGITQLTVNPFYLEEGTITQVQFRAVRHVEHIQVAARFTPEPNGMLARMIPSSMDDYRQVQAVFSPDSNLPEVPPRAYSVADTLSMGKTQRIISNEKVREHDPQLGVLDSLMGIAGQIFAQHQGKLSLVMRRIPVDKYTERQHMLFADLEAKGAIDIAKFSLRQELVMHTREV